jgi:predicted nucleotidyltransferase
MTPEQRLKEKRDELLRIAAKHGATDVRVFGSVARGEADEQSDIDLLVCFEPGRSLLDHAGLWLDLEALLDCRVDVVSEGGLKPRLKDRVLSEAVPI